MQKNTCNTENSNMIVTNWYRPCKIFSQAQFYICRTIPPNSLITTVQSSPTNPDNCQPTLSSEMSQFRWMWGGLDLLALWSETVNYMLDPKGYITCDLVVGCARNSTSHTIFSGERNGPMISQPSHPICIFDLCEYELHILKLASYYIYLALII